MASFDPASHLKNITGKVDRIVYSRNKSGPIMYVKTYHKYEPSLKQISANHLMKSNAKLWNNELSDSQYEAWHNYAQKLQWYNKKGKKYTPAGYDAFTQINCNFQEIGLPAVLDPPKKVSAQFFSKFSLEIPSVQAFDNLLLFFKPVIRKDTRIKIFATSFLKISTVTVKPSLYRKIGYIDNSFFSGKSIFYLYSSVFQKEQPPMFKIAFTFIPVSAISGLTSHPYEVRVSFRQNVKNI